MSNLYLYFSGTGNSKYVTEKFALLYENDNDYIIKSIEHSNIDYDKLIKEAEIITIAYPIHDSMMPFIMQEFLDLHFESFRDKEIIVIATQVLFSGDGAVLAKRKLRGANVKLLHSIHVNMPNNLTDLSIFKSFSLKDSKDILEKADQKLAKIVNRIKAGKTIRDGRAIYSWFAGFFTQRLWGHLFIKKLRKAVKVDYNKCIICRKCVEACPTQNLYLEDEKIKVLDKCTLCYRCVNICPTQAISIFTKKKPKIQYIRKDYN